MRRIKCPHATLLSSEAYQTSTGLITIETTEEQKKRSFLSEKFAPFAFFFLRGLLRSQLSTILYLIDGYKRENRVELAQQLAYQQQIIIYVCQYVRRRAQIME